jgi:hypothetical protein
MPLSRHRTITITGITITTGIARLSPPSDQGRFAAVGNG